MTSTNPELDAPRTHLDELIDVMARLRAPGGCPWDAEQTHESLVRYLIEECFELVEAIESGTRDDLLEELGDVLYQVVFHADIAAADPVDPFDIQDVAAAMTRKMVARHPHVFAGIEVEDSDEVIANWEAIKAVEKAHRSSVLDGIPRAMPALALADKMLGKAAKLGVLPQVSHRSASWRDEDALGDELLGLVAEAKALGLDAERALRSAIRRLEARVVESEAT